MFLHLIERKLPSAGSAPDCLLCWLGGGQDEMRSGHSVQVSCRGGSEPAVRAATAASHSAHLQEARVRRKSQEEESEGRDVGTQSQGTDTQLVS